MDRRDAMCRSQRYLPKVRGSSRSGSRSDRESPVQTGLRVAADWSQWRSCRRSGLTAAGRANHPWPQGSRSCEAQPHARDGGRHAYFRRNDALRSPAATRLHFESVFGVASWTAAAWRKSRLRRLVARTKEDSGLSGDGSVRPLRGGNCRAAASTRRSRRRRQQHCRSRRNPSNARSLALGSA